MRTDVCLILEGTYPYVAGGVSTWVAQMLQQMAHLRFSILFIWPSRDTPRSAKYRIPPNVADFKEVFLFDYPSIPENYQPEQQLSDEDYEAIGRFERDSAAARAIDLEETIRAVEKLPEDRDLVWNLAHSEEAWDRAVRQYEEFAPEGTSFLHYFWSHRFINVPALSLLRTKIPRARVYHAACTGYAGLLGAKAALRTGAPLLVTEHGIYASERKVEIFNARWIRDTTNGFLDMRGSDFFKEWWIRFFQSLSRTTYQSAAEITSLFDVNRWIQQRDGAPPEKTSVIPNGIDTSRYAGIQPRKRRSGQPLRVGLVGRVAPIKDVKTFLKSLWLLKKRSVEVEGYVLGAMDEDEAYASECLEMTERLGLEEDVEFTGYVDVFDYLGYFDVVAITSVSEGLPFAVLEAGASGLPVVATDVGACRELLHGRTAEDKALGRSGIVTPVATPNATASALERMARSPRQARRMGEAGRRRIKRFYDIREVTSQYTQLYENYLYTAGKGEAV